jgi:hypothetical protein
LPVKLIGTNVGVVLGFGSNRLRLGRRKLSGLEAAVDELADHHGLSSTTAHPHQLLSGDRAALAQ